ncbi:MAG: dihydrodipicolinate synthase family protein [Armatimonadetes bacterium]|nr:dihydrodipicolinate synthase family protein [Armatimonadota bacterium]
MTEIEGIVPVLPTPFHGDGSLDEESLRAVVEFCVAEQAAAVCLPAYAGEFYKLSEAERLRVVQVAAEQARGRVPVIGQANHASPTTALALAQAMEAAGAELISLAAPRLFGLSEADLLCYFGVVCRGLRTGLLVQDFNPGGSTVGAEFAARLADAHPNFRYLKLEDPLMGSRIRAIREATGGRIGVLEGWGGMYMLELIPCGICGVMPGAPLLRILNQVFRKRKAGENAAAYAFFQQALPWIVFTLQHMELFLHAEKRLLHRLGVLGCTHVRDATIAVDSDTGEYVEWLISQVLPLLQ